MTLVYKTVGASSQSLHRVLGSRHLGFLFPVSTEGQVKEHLERLSREYSDSTHICYAWRLGWDKNRYGSADDGEPSGTAGKPILGQLISFDLTNVMIAVVRYYGGTKLGTGGLIDAYRTAARLAIEDTEIIEREVSDRYSICFPYSGMPEVMTALKEMGMEKISLDTGDWCLLEFRISSTQQNRIEALADLIPQAELNHLGRE